ncbi:Uncharacterised protein [Burkholderia pseudomallei]|nr:Uncharacterised protein [Burkholderia pseudomallei]CAK0182975.1 Uncharacterised protein [Burkholderia pseudomallei]CFL74901.1 Uncharacterised protein [Burkholderia pseudomallei]CFW02256.1 Uncharacterised protein [Burkholderia pseudomallei]CPI03208.1 Uncharacterised protein [Burkholderia pseudomallei]
MPYAPLFSFSFLWICWLCMYIVENRFAAVRFVKIVEIMSFTLSGSVTPFFAICGSSTFSSHSSGDALNRSPPSSAPGLIRLIMPILLYSTFVLSSSPSFIISCAARTVVLPW